MIVSGTEQKLRVFYKDKMIGGEPVRVECVEINGQVFSFERKLVTTVSLDDEWYEDVYAPECVISLLADFETKPDIFRFWQRVPETEPKYRYHLEWESLAVLPIKDFEYWWNKQVKGTTRNMVRKSQKAGVEVRQAVFDDDFVRGVVDIFNEVPVRQGKQFWHYGKGFETVKRQFSRFLFREEILGAYYQGELIGFAMLADAGRFGVVGQFIAKLKHRDKATNNALMAKAVEVCEKKRWSYLVYTTWRETSLVDFKRHCGFQEMKIPRYFVPLTYKGKLALKFGFHRGLKNAIPQAIEKPLKRIRKRWYDLSSPAVRLG